MKAVYYATFGCGVQSIGLIGPTMKIQLMAPNHTTAS